MNNELSPTVGCILLPRSPALTIRSMETTKEENAVFVIEEVSTIVKEAIGRVIGSNVYHYDKVNRWTADIVDQILTELNSEGKPFKYIVQAVVMQKNGAGLHTASSCLWNNTTDGSCTVRWENKYVYAIVSVFGLAI